MHLFNRGYVGNVIRILARRLTADCSKYSESIYPFTLLTPWRTRCEIRLAADNVKLMNVDDEIYPGI